jgi:hypothetical protein
MRIKPLKHQQANTKRSQRMDNPRALRLAHGDHKPHRSRYTLQLVLGCRILIDTRAGVLVNAFKIVGAHGSVDG